MAQAPPDFGRFSHNLLIGQFAGGGDTQSSGYIAAYDLSTGKFNGLLQDADGKPLAIKGVLALGSGNAGPNDSDSPAVPAAGLFFTAASSPGFGGLFGYVAAVSTVDRLAEASRLTPGSATNIQAQISSIPAGADIQVDGAYVGATPSDIELTCCWHDVTIRKARTKALDKKGALRRPRSQNHCPSPEMRKEFLRNGQRCDDLHLIDSDNCDAFVSPYRCESVACHRQRTAPVEHRTGRPL